MRRTWRRTMMLMVLLAGLVPLLPVGVVVANDAVVSTCDEESFDEALDDVQTTGGGTITFSCSGQIDFTSEKAISAAVTIIGGGNITFDRGGNTQLFIVSDGATLELDGVTLVHGSAAYGGAILNVGGTVTVTSSTFSGNSAFYGGAIFNSFGTVTVTSSTFSGNNATYDGSNGGAIFNVGTLTVTSSTFSGNSADSDGGAIFNVGTLTVTSSTFSSNSADSDGGAIYNVGLLTVTSSTFSGNSADSDGGTIFNLDGGLLTVTSSTFSDNSADSDGGVIYNLGTVNVGSSILANSPSGGNCGGDAITSQGSNLSDDASCNLTAPGDQPSTDPQLGPLADNGGPTETMLPGSPAIDAALSCATDIDQRGISRPQGPACDIGSVEVLVAETLPLCVNGYTGAVSSPASGQCPPGQQELAGTAGSFCINPYTGKVSYVGGGLCGPSFQPHLMPDDGALLTCVSRYTGANRAVADHLQCLVYELPNIIVATPVF